MFFFKQKTAYDMRISDWSSDVCSSDLFIFGDVATAILVEDKEIAPAGHWDILGTKLKTVFSNNIRNNFGFLNRGHGGIDQSGPTSDKLFVQEGRKVFKEVVRSEEHTSELQSLMRISYAVFCLKKKKRIKIQ